MKVAKKDGRIFVKSFYNQDLPSRAKEIGGRWSPDLKAWHFDAEDEEHVKRIYLDVYGEWPEDEGASNAVKVKITAKKDLYGAQTSVFFAGRTIARAFGRDSGARLGEGIIKLSGEIESSGSRKNWFTDVFSGASFEVKNVPLEKAVSDDDWEVEIL